MFGNRVSKNSNSELSTQHSALLSIRRGGHLALSTSKRLDSIDALRGIAALMVAGYHVWGHYGVYPFPSLGVVPWTKSAGILAYIVSPLRWGYLGVGLFLVLSGFCIHLPYARKKYAGGIYHFEWRKFYLRRLWRLYPAYAVSVIGTFLLLVITAHRTDYVDGPPTMGDLISHLTLTHGYFDKYFYSIVHVYWSLALEFELYLAYPLFLYLFVKAGLTRSIIVLSIFSIAWRFVALDVFHSQLISVAWTGPYAMMGFVFARMPEWLFGAWLAEWFVRGGNQKVTRLPLIGTALIGLFIAILSTLSEPMWVFTDMLFGLGFAFIVAAAIVPRKMNAPILTHVATPSDGAILENDVNRVSPPYRWLIWVGMISYSLYLFHMQFSWFANPWIRQLASPSLQFVLRAIVLLISIPLIAIVYRFVEKPFLSPPKPGERFYSVYAWIGRTIGIKSGSDSG